MLFTLLILCVLSHFTVESINEEHRRITSFDEISKQKQNKKKLN